MQWKMFAAASLALGVAAAGSSTSHADGKSDHEWTKSKPILLCFMLFVIVLIGRSVVGNSGMKVFTGNSNKKLARDIAGHLRLSLGHITVNKFADGEVNVMINENVRGKDVYIIQPTSPPVNETLMELLLMISTMRRASARKITAVIPYYGYARQDRKMQARVPISAADVARLLEAMGIDRVIAVDLHCGQIQVGQHVYRLYKLLLRLL